MLSVNDQLDNIRSQFESIGLIFPESLVYGKMTRVKTQDDKGSKKSGWYVCHEFRLDNGNVAITGKFGNWKDSDQKHNIDVDWKGFSAEEQEKLKVQQQEQQKAAQKEKLESQNQAKERANKIWGNLPTQGYSDYLKRKKVFELSARFCRGSIVVPVFNAQLEIVSLQFIQANGDKKFITGGQKEGCFYFYGDIENAEQIVLCEGFATAASLYMALKIPVVSVFDCYNLPKAGKAIRARYPKTHLIIAADNDQFTKGNPGETYAKKTASIIGASVFLPDFSCVENISENAA